MKKVFNFRIVPMLIYAFIISLLAVASLTGEEPDIPLFIGFAVFTLVPIFVIFISPVTFTFSEEGIEIRYFFGYNEVFRWTEITSIEKKPVVPRGLILKDYHIVQHGGSEGKQAFFTIGNVNANRKTKELIRRFRKKDIG